MPAMRSARRAIRAAGTRADDTNLIASPQFHAQAGEPHARGAHRHHQHVVQHDIDNAAIGRSIEHIKRRRIDADIRGPALAQPPAIPLRMQRAKDVSYFSP